MISQWKAFLIEKTPEWNLPQSGNWTFLFHNNYHPHCSSINLLWFHGKDRFPRVVTKLYREPQILTREFQNLTEAHRYGPRWVPKPLHFGPHGGLWALWMEGVPGFRLQPAKAVPAALEPIVDLVASLHQAMTTEPRQEYDRYRRAVLEPLHTLAGFGGSGIVRAGCERVRSQITADWLAGLPVIPQHGDLFHSNVLCHGSQHYLVDWETFGFIDLPCYDVLTLLLSVLRAGGDVPAHWNSSLKREVPRLVQRYAEALHLTAADISRLLPLTLANWFHLQWCDGRREFTELMYRTVGDYFEHEDDWARVFLPRLP